MVVSRKSQSKLAPWMLALVLIASCGSGEDGTMQDEPRVVYPLGPYGFEAGSVIQDLSFVTPVGAPLSFADIFADSHNRLLLLTTAAGWCSSCIEEQPALQELNETYRDQGLFVMVSLFEKQNFDTADAEYAKTWQETHELTFSVVADPDFILKEYYNEDLTPMVMMVNLNTMTIINLSTGWDRNQVESIINVKL